MKYLQISMAMNALGLMTFLSIEGCKSRASRALDTAIVGTSPEDQRSTAFCWAYAIVAHLEQRHFEDTRGFNGGGFRLNFSEEYLGLAYLYEQLTDDKELPLSEGLLLSQGLRLVEKYGIVPEKIGDHLFFKPKFDESIAKSLGDAAHEYWQSHGMNDNVQLAKDVALQLIAQTAALNSEQQKFFAGAVGFTDRNDSLFKYGKNPQTGEPFLYTPQTFAKRRLKFAPENYFTLRYPDSGRTAGEGAFAEDYERALKMVRKAMLYGYSVPISFNIVHGSVLENGTVGCVEKGCANAQISRPSPTNPHANHAVLLVDYKTENTDFAPVSQATIDTSYALQPMAWVVKNSWGMNNNTSTDPQLLSRFPLPAFTVLTQDFLESSHRLDPERYQALLPRKLCLRSRELDGDRVCEDFILAVYDDGMPTAREVQLALNTPLILANIQKGLLSRYPVTFHADVPEIPADDKTLTLVQAGAVSNPTGLPQVNLERSTIVQTGGAQFRLCTAVAVDQHFKYVGVYFSETNLPPVHPAFILSEQNHWQYCGTQTRPPGTYAVYFQAITERYEVLGQVTAQLTIR